MLWERWFEGTTASDQAHLLLDLPRSFALHSLADLPRPVLVITGNTSPYYLQDLLEQNPDGLIALDTTPEQIKESLSCITQGQHVYLGPRLGRAEHLTTGERAVLRHLALGLDDGQIALRLRISKKTVGNRIAELYDKTGSSNRVQLALQYLGMSPASSRLLPRAEPVVAIAR